MTTAWGAPVLARFPEDPRDRLRAWDASDEYLLRHLDDRQVPLSGTVVVVGDRWGALVTALAAHRPTQITDSWLGQEATRANLARNGVEPGTVRLLTTQDTPPDRVDVLLVRVPKSLALLEDQLLRLAPAVHEGTVVVGTGMVKEIHTSTLDLFERILGPTRTSLAERKARLIHCSPDPARERPANPWPYRYALPDGIGPVSGRTVVNHAGVFCADRLDIGTRFFLRHLPAGPAGSVDLVLNNPPFHSHQATTDATARRMFGDARRTLREGGELWVIGNRHLGYHVTLRRLFGNSELVAGDRKFVVLRAVRRG